MRRTLRVLLPAAGVALLLDQASKLWITLTLPRGEEIPLIDSVFFLTHVRNPGASFSLFMIEDPTRRLLFFGGLSLLAIGVIVDFARRLEPGARAAALALGAILGGVVGNLIDRVAYGEVVDFLRVFLTRSYSWPDFNFADSFIVCGVIYLVFDAVFGGRWRDSPSAGG